jgi:hypothetical protein
MAKRLPKPTPSAEVLHEMLAYDADTGALTWKVRPEKHFQNAVHARAWNNKMAGKPALASAQPQTRYLNGRIDWVAYQAHRVVWKMAYGEDALFIDHINGDRTDNRISNLRSVSSAENAKNKATPSHNTSGHVGVTWLKREQKWFAQVQLAGKCKSLGYYSDIRDAIAARQKANEQYGFHPNHGRAA